MSPVLLLFCAGLGIARANPGIPPLDRYLDAGELRAALQDRQEALAPCGQGLADGAWPLQLAVDGSGAVGDLRLEDMDAAPVPDGLASCLAETLAGLPLRTHDEVPVEVEGTVVLRGGRVALGPVIDVHEHHATLLFLHLPPDLDPAERRSLLQLLGLVPQEAAGD